MTGKDHPQSSVAARTKGLLADHLKRIELDEFINGHVRTAIAALSLEHFPVNGTFPNEEFAKRVANYEAAIGDLQAIVILLARWGDTEQLLLLEKILARLAEADKSDGGTIVWLRLGWYPLLILIYAGCSSFASGRDHFEPVLDDCLKINEAWAGVENVDCAEKGLLHFRGKREECIERRLQCCTSGGRRSVAKPFSGGAHVTDKTCHVRAKECSRTGVGSNRRGN